MTGPGTIASSVFADAAVLVIRRMWLRKSVAWLKRSLPIAAGLLAVLLVLRILGAAKWSTVAAGFCRGAAVARWLPRLRLVAQAATLWRAGLWDQRVGRADAFANAWWFERQPERSIGQRIHLDAQAAALPAALGSLRRDIPLPDMRWLSLVPVLALAIFLAPHHGALELPDPALTAEGKKLAVEEGKRLADKKLDADKMQALTEEEKKDIEKLQQKVQDTAKSLEQQAKTTRGVLSELERRAHDAERLAEKLGAGEAAWASEQMVAEMRKHTDTAELGDAAANKSTGATAREAQKLADLLKNPQLTHETRDRIAETLRSIEKQAQPQDAQRTVGGHVLDAGKDMAQTLPKDAAKEFQSLADQMKALAQRDKAREELEKLAQQLRDSGATIAGQGSEGMQQLAGNSNGNGQSGGASSSQMQAMANAPQMQSMQMPSFSNAPQAQGQQGQQNIAQNMPTTTLSPDGEKGNGKGQAPMPGKDSDQNINSGQPFLFAPVPGMPEGQQAPMAILGSSPNGNVAGQMPGNGTTGLGNKPTQATKAKQSSVVNAASNAEGESAVRSIDGTNHPENAARSAQATALQSITEEENALDESALPSARRDQVRRYFTELRKRFEKQN